MLAKTPPLVAVGLILLTGCGDAQLTTLPASPPGLGASWAFDDCAPWDGAATTVYLAGTQASDPLEASYPHAWVSLYRPATDLAGRTFRWNTDDKDTGGAMWCAAAGECEAATTALVRFRQTEGPAPDLSGMVDLTFPSGARVTGGFRAVWMTHQLLCG